MSLSVGIRYLVHVKFLIRDMRKSVASMERPWLLPRVVPVRAAQGRVTLVTVAILAELALHARELAETVGQAIGDDRPGYDTPTARERFLAANTAFAVTRQLALRIGALDSQGRARRDWRPRGVASASTRASVASAIITEYQRAHAELRRVQDRYVPQNRADAWIAEMEYLRARRDAAMRLSEIIS
jgi:hypothetical protein